MYVLYKVHYIIYFRHSTMGLLHCSENIAQLLGRFSYMADNNIQHNGNRVAQQRMPARRKVVDLSFDNHISFGEWIYNSAFAIIAVVVALLCLIFALLFSTFEIKRAPQPQATIIVELESDTVIPEEEEEEKRDEKRDMDDLYRSIRQEVQQELKNVQSNEMAQEDGGSQYQVFDQEVRDMMEQVERSEQGYDSNPNEGNDFTTLNSRGHNAGGMGSGGEGEGIGSGKGKGEGRNFNGRVLVSYRFEDPKRSARSQLYTPGYRAEHSGKVVIEVYVDRNGNVKRSKVLSSSGISQLDKEALNAARHKLTIFNIDGAAPMEQRGTITYEFVAQ